MTIKIYLTGRIALDVDGDRVIEERHFRGKQARIAFAYLISERARPVPREELAEVVWPGEMAPAWEVALSALISRLRGLLSSDSLKANDVSLSSGFGLYRLLVPSDTWIDTEVAATAIDEAEMAVHSGELNSIRSPATIAANISRRPFLPDCDGTWVESQRNKLSRQLVRALECHTKMWLHGEEPTLAIETAIEAVTLDPFRESSHLLLMQAYTASGNRAEAVKTYHQLREFLAEELGTNPSLEAETLYLDLLK